MIILKDYINFSKIERQSHINLSESCLERGGNSTNHRGVLAQFLNSDIPGHKILLAHACNNQKCSNPHHLYWSTHYENTVEDGAHFGTWKNPWIRTVEKYGLEEAKRMNSGRNMSKMGSGNKGKPKSEEHKKKISESLKNKTRV